MATKQLFTAVQWISWMGATIVACMALTAFAYSTFQTKDDARENKIDLIQRLTRIEDKQDQLLTQRKSE